MNNPEQIYSVVADQVEQGRYILSVRMRSKARKPIRTLYAIDFTNCMEVCNEHLGRDTYYIIF